MKRALLMAINIMANNNTPSREQESIAPATANSRFTTHGHAAGKGGDGQRAVKVKSDGGQGTFVRFCAEHRPAALRSSIFSAGVGTFCRAPVCCTLSKQMEEMETEG
jgi:hypothetical protein